MEGELAKNATGLLIAYVVVKEAFALIREFVGWKRNGNGNGNGYDPSTRAILGWLTTEGREISTAAQRAGATLGALLDINTQHLEATQNHTMEQRRQHTRVLEAFAKEQ